MSMNPKVQAVFRTIVGLLFIWAAISKLRDPSEFLASVYAYQLPLPEALAKGVAMALPFLELICGVLLLINCWSESAGTVALVLLVLFAAATGQAWARGLEISCGCFDLKMLGIQQGSSVAKFVESARFAFFRNLLLAALIFFSVRYEWIQLKKSSVPA
jgi:putative oxidoreductase